MTVFPSFRDLFRISILLPCLMAGCGGEVADTDDTDDTDEVETKFMENSGYACLNDDGDDDTSTGAIQVTLADCLSGCAEVVDATCQASVVEQSIEVTASGEYQLPLAEEQTCLTVCVELVANCDVSGIMEDTWTLSYAGDSVEIDFPSSAGTCTHLGD